MKRFSEANLLGVTIICKCTKCSGLILAAQGQKTKTCPYCGKKINIQCAKKIAKAETAFEASEILKVLKAKLAADKKSG
ncbi:MAG: DUF1922 domain-containing protein [Candidatus Bathyarchaeota archaeon]|nr:DUF1922 domain-containing protein [Candidatus Bathyarchaeota archaeon]